MEANLRRALKSAVLELRRILEGCRDPRGRWIPGDLHRRLEEIRAADGTDPSAGVSRRTGRGRTAPRTAAAEIAEPGAGSNRRKDADRKIVAEAAYAWAIRLLALRCLAARGLYPGNLFGNWRESAAALDPASKVERREPPQPAEASRLLPRVDQAFRSLARQGLSLFSADDRGLCLRPSPEALLQCLTVLGGAPATRAGRIAASRAFQPPTALGWAYQYWNTTEKADLFARLGSSRGVKIEGRDLIAATLLYTEDYMARFLLQNSLGALWKAMHPRTRLVDRWEYFVADVDRGLVPATPVDEITLLDPACGSGHFLLEAFDVFYAMYQEEGRITDPAEICRSILQRNLYGIDIDPRAVRIAEAVLWMKACQRCPATAPIPAGLGVARDAAGSKPSPPPPDSPDGNAPGGSAASRLAVDSPLAPQAAPADLGELGSLAQVPAARPGTSARLAELLSRKYDVVTTNPPFMTSRHMGSALRDYLVRCYPYAWRDLYAAFMERCLQLTGDGGFAALVTQQSFLALAAYTDFRRHVLAANALELAAHLGTNAFQAIPGQKVATVLTVLRKGQQRRNSTFLDAREAADKPRALREQRCPRFQFRADDRLQLPGAPLLYDLEENLATVFKSGVPLGSLVTITGSQNVTAENARRVRCFWEVAGPDWLPYCKGGGYATYCEAQEHVVDFSPEAQQSYRRKSTANLLSRDRWDRPHGITYTDISCTQFAARRLARRGPFDKSGPVLFPRAEHAWSLLGILNSHVVHRLLKTLNPTLHVQVRDLRRLPVPQKALRSKRLASLARDAYQARRKLLAQNPTTRLFLPAAAELGGDVQAWLAACLQHRWDRELVFVLAKWAADREAANAYGVALPDLPPLAGDAGRSPPEIAGRLWDATPENRDPPKTLPGPGEVDLCRRISEGLSCRPAGKANGAANPSAVDLGITPEVPLERLSLHLGVHPISLRLCLQEHPQAAAACLQDLLCDWTGVLCLAGLGHRWPRERERSTFAEQGGGRVSGIRLVDPEHAPQLCPEAVAMLRRGVERVCGESERGAGLAGEAAARVLDSWRKAFPAVLGKTIDRWLAADFFREHTRRFRKRPVVWQLSSRRAGGRELPAFSCLVHCQQVDGELLPEIRSRQAIPLRDACLRELESEQPDREKSAGRTPPKILQKRCDELTSFERKLSEVIRSGFACDDLRQYAIGDALHCLTSRWLERLEARIRMDCLPALAGRVPAAGRRQAMECLDRAFRGLARCATRCCPTVPPEWRSGPLPSPPAIAQAVCDREPAMIASAIADARRRLRGELRRLPASQAAARKAAEQIGREIQDGQVAETHQWKTWLAEQPLYDPCSQLDVDGPPPTTVQQWIAIESVYRPAVDDGVRVNIAPLQRAGLLAAPVLAPRDVERAIADRARWRADRRRHLRSAGTTPFLEPPPSDG